MEDNDIKIKAFWDSVRHLGVWTGAIVDIEWDDLWQGAKDEIQLIFYKIRDKT